MDVARELLQQLTELYPPPKGKAHSLELVDKGLVLLLWHPEIRRRKLPGGRVPLSFSEAELSLSAGELVDEVRSALWRLGLSSHVVGLRRWRRVMATDDFAAELVRAIEELEAEPEEPPPCAGCRGYDDYCGPLGCSEAVLHELLWALFGWLWVLAGSSLDAWTHELRWQCESCGRWQGPDEGCADDYPDLCDDCWAVATLTWEEGEEWDG